MTAHLGRQSRQSTRAVSDDSHRHAKVLKNSQVEIGDRRIRGIPKVAPAPDRAAASPGNENRQVDVSVTITVAETRAIENHRTVQKRALAVPRCLESVEQGAECLNMQRVDLGQSREFFRIVLVM